MVDRLESVAEVEHPDVGSDQPLSALTASMFFGTLVFLALATAPIMLGALVEDGRLSNATLGLVATSEILGIALGSTFGPGFLQAGRFRAKVFVACLALVILNWSCTAADTAVSISIVRTLCGLLEGIVLAAANLIITYSRNPEGMSGYFLGITTIPQIAATYLLSSYAIPVFGPNVGFQLMAVCAAASCVACLGATGEHIPKINSERAAFGKWSPWAIVALVTIILQNAAIGAGFSYVVQFAKQAGVSNDVVGLAFAGLNATAVLGSLCVGFFAWRFYQTVTLTIGCIIQAAVTLTIVHVGGAIAFVVSLGVFGLCWNALLPFSLKLLIELDPTRKLGLLNSPASMIGLGLGPILGSWFVTPTDVTPAFWAAAVMFAVSGGLYLIVGLVGQRMRASEQI